PSRPAPLPSTLSRGACLSSRHGCVTDHIRVPGRKSWLQVPPALSLIRTNQKISSGGVSVSTVKLTVNGKAVSVDVEDRTLLVQLLRENLNLTGTHVGCDTSQCGACVVHIDGRAVKSCTVPAAQAAGSNVPTLGTIAKGDELHP